MPMSGIPVASEIEAHRQTGVHVSNQPSTPIFATVVDVTASRVVGTVYQNTTGRPMLITLTSWQTGGTDTDYHTLKSDSANPPTIERARSRALATALGGATQTILVLPNHYYMLSNVGSASAGILKWIEWS